MPVISFVTQKGGSGKTTLALNCAVAAQGAGYKVLILDMDPQKTAEKWYQKRDDDNLQPVLVTVKPSEVGRAVEAGNAKGFDVIFIDTPGHDSPGAADAIMASDFCIMPCRPTVADIEATPTTYNTVKRLLRPIAFVLTQTMPRRKKIIGLTKEPHPRTREAAEGLSRIGQVAPVHITTLTAYPDAQGLGLGVTEYEPDGTASMEIKAMWNWMLVKLNEVSDHDKEKTNVS